MASVGTLAHFIPVFLPASGAGLAYLAHRARYVEWRTRLRDFLTGPGRTSRILLLLFILMNLKSMPLVWTARVWHALAYHLLWRRRRVLPPRALFRYSVTSSRTTLLETDYNLHKSNATYFSDLDVSRSHLVTHLMGPGMRRITKKPSAPLSTVDLPPQQVSAQPSPAAVIAASISGTNDDAVVVRDAEGRPVHGAFGIGLGAVFCSFRREVAPYRKYEIWSRVLAWDRKWLYIVTHFVLPVGGKQPRVDDRALPRRQDEDLNKYVAASAVSKYVFKLGRFTVHPAILMEASGLLPPRPGGVDAWRGGEEGVGVFDEESLANGDGADVNEWNWKTVEQERRRGMQLASHFAALDGTNASFTGGLAGVLGHFPLG